MHELAEDDNKDINADPDVQTSTVNAIKKSQTKAPAPKIHANTITKRRANAKRETASIVADPI